MAQGDFSFWANRGATENSVAEKAAALLRGTLSGVVSEAMMSELAEAVLSHEATRLALKVRAGGPHAMRRAIELAALVMAAKGRER